MENAKITAASVRHHNALGFLRILFASLVIVSHVPEIVDNGPQRELLYRITGTMTFGSFAVFGFFVISGFLISESYLKSRSIRSYVIKRIARIYPAFAVASLICMAIVAPLSDADMSRFSAHNALAVVARIAILARPKVEGAFPGQHFNDPHSALDGAMWTIQFEFACYLLVILLGSLGVLRRPWVLAALAALCFAVAALLPTAGAAPWSHEDLFPGSYPALPTLVGMFTTGALFRHLRHRIPMTRPLAAAAAVGLVASLQVPTLVVPGYAVFGTYLIFAFAHMARDTRVGRINGRNDISYGLYLYAWPVEQLLIRFTGTGSLIALGLATWLGAAALGAASWFIVERRAMALVKAR